MSTRKLKTVQSIFRCPFARNHHSYSSQALASLRTCDVLHDVTVNHGGLLQLLGCNLAWPVQISSCWFQIYKQMLFKPERTTETVEGSTHGEHFMSTNPQTLGVYICFFVYIWFLGGCSAASFIAEVWQYISLHLHLLQAILVPVLQYGCQISGMHNPRVAVANDACAALQRLYDYYLRTVCCLSPSTPRKLLLTELGLLPLQVFGWRQTLQFWNSLAVLPAGSLYHTVCLDKLADASQGGACSMASLLAAYLHSVGFEMPRVHDVVPLLDVDGVVEALTAHLQGTGSGSLYCPRAAPTQGVVSCTYEKWFKPYSPHRRYCQPPISGRRMQRFLACSDFCSLGWAVMACQLLLAVWLVLAMWTGLTGFVWLAAVVPLVMRSI